MSSAKGSKVLTKLVNLASCMAAWYCLKRTHPSESRHLACVRMHSSLGGDIVQLVLGQPVQVAAQHVNGQIHLYTQCISTPPADAKAVADTPLEAMTITSSRAEM